MIPYLETSHHIMDAGKAQEPSIQKLHGSSMRKEQLTEILPFFSSPHAPSEDLASYGYDQFPIEGLNDLHSSYHFIPSGSPFYSNQFDSTNNEHDLVIRVQLPTPQTPTAPFNSCSHVRYPSEQSLTSCESILSERPNSTMSLSRTSSAHDLYDLYLPSTPLARQNSLSSFDETYDTQPPPPPKSPVNRFTALFRWQSGFSQRGRSPSSTSSISRAHSQSLSPTSLAPSVTLNDSIPPVIDVFRANSVYDNGLPTGTGYTLPPPTPGLGMGTSYELIEEELRMISVDLAASIKREMELEDLVERLEAEAGAASNGNSIRERRTSDYFSDIGTPIRGVDILSRHDQDMEKLRRKAEQEKAQIRLEMLAKISDERQRRKNAEAQLKELEDHVSRGEYSQLVSTDARKVTKLTAQLEDARRKLAEEKQARENFEQLANAIREEMEAYRNERDDLRNNEIPALQYKVQSLERNNANMLELANENAKELTALRSAQHQVSEKDVPEGRVITSQSKKLSRLPMVTSKLPSKEAETIAEKLKDTEEQRDALHEALRRLHERQQIESKKAQLRIKALEMERDNMLNNSPRRFANSREIANLRREVNYLRQRADDAFEAKLGCERNLMCLKMDLEKAEQETANLRALLYQHDALITQHEELKQSHTRLSKQVSALKERNISGSETISAALQRAYHDLQTTHELTLTRLDVLESEGTNLSDDFEIRLRRLQHVQQESEKAMQQLRQSLVEAEAERDNAQVEAEAYRKQTLALQSAEMEHITEERSLEAQLRSSTQRVKELAEQVEIQIESNRFLRARLAAAIGHGEYEQQLSASRINELQGKLRNLEEKVVQAQQETEEIIANHEAEIKQMQENHSVQLRRLKSNLLTPSSPLSPKMPLSPLLKSPKLGWTKEIGGGAGAGGSGSDSGSPKSTGSSVEYLQKRVEELEKALTEADEEMAEVVGRMSLAQIEVMELTSQKEEAARQTRKLQADLVAEKGKNISTNIGR